MHCNQSNKDVRKVLSCIYSDCMFVISYNICALTGGSQQSLHLQWRGRKICLPEDTFSPYRDADWRVLVRRRQKHKKTGVTLEIAAVLPNLHKLHSSLPKTVQTERYSALPEQTQWDCSTACAPSRTENIYYYYLKIFYHFIATLHFANHFEDELRGGRGAVFSSALFWGPTFTL